MNKKTNFKNNRNHKNKKLMNIILKIKIKINNKKIYQKVILLINNQIFLMKMFSFLLLKLKLKLNLKMIFLMLNLKNVKIVSIYNNKFSNYNNVKNVKIYNHK